MSTRVCPYCGSPLSATDIFCTQCGSVLDGPPEHDDDVTRFVYDDPDDLPRDADDSPVRQSSGSFHTDTRLVDDLGSLQPDDSRRQRTDIDSNPPGPGTKRFVLAILGLVLTAVALGAVFWFLHQDTQETPTYTISFETNGGEQMESLEVEQGKKVFTPTDPTRPGYDFEGWFTKSDFSEKATFPFEAQGDLILYAKWEKSESSSGTTTPGTTQTTEDDSTDDDSQTAVPVETPVAQDSWQDQDTTGTEQQAIGFLGITGAQASSVHEVSGEDRGPYGAACVLDGELTTAWVEGAAGNGEGESITLTGPTQTISGFDIWSGYHKYSRIGTDLYTWNARPAHITVYAHGTAVCSLTLADAGHQSQRVTFPQPVETDSITIVIDSVYAGNDSDCAISEISCF